MLLVATTATRTRTERKREIPSINFVSIKFSRKMAKPKRWTPKQNQSKRAHAQTINDNFSPSVLLQKILVAVAIFITSKRLSFLLKKSLLSLCVCLCLSLPRPSSFSSCLVSSRMFSANKLNDEQQYKKKRTNVRREKCYLVRVKVW